MTSRLSLRRLLAILLGVLGVLVAALFVLTTLQLRGANLQTEAENRRTESFRLADQMRQTSNDLTRMVRMYVATGDPRFRDHYEEILAIRAGEAPRPRDYDSSFWDRVLAEGKGFVEYGRPESLTDQLRAARFAPAEFAALNAALRESNDLASLELRVMERVEKRIDRGVDDDYFGDVNSDYRLLVDDAYLAEKGVIMAAIERFIDLVDQRTLRDVEDVRADNQRLFVGPDRDPRVDRARRRRGDGRPHARGAASAFRTRRCNAPDRRRRLRRAGAHPRGVGARAGGRLVQRHGGRGPS